MAGLKAVAVLVDLLIDIVTADGSTGRRGERTII
jgi:hypothetical protein